MRTVILEQQDAGIDAFLLPFIEPIPPLIKTGDELDIPTQIMPPKEYSVKRISRPPHILLVQPRLLIRQIHFLALDIQTFDLRRHFQRIARGQH